MRHHDATQNLLSKFTWRVVQREKISTLKKHCFALRRHDVAQLYGKFYIQLPYKLRNLFHIILIQNMLRHDDTKGTVVEARRKIFRGAICMRYLIYVLRRSDASNYTNRRYYILS